jgi:uncharacterized membrane protein YhaH (DUF805 family)
VKWYVYSLRKYAVFKGRASRREHWTFELTNSVITLALFVAVVMVASVGYQYFVSLPFIYIAATTVPSLASLVRRLHDTNRSGWWFFVSLVPVVGPLILFSMTVTRSDPGQNRFGPNFYQQSTTKATVSPDMGYLAPPIDQRDFRQ